MNTQYKQKILHISQSAGGVERYIYMLLNNSNQEKFDHILICSDQFNVELFKDLVSKIVIVKMKREINLINDFQSIKQLRNILKEEKPDIVYLHSSKAGALGRLASLWMKHGIIYNAHGWAFNMRCSFLKKMIYILIEKSLSFKCHKIISISKYEKQSALKYKICKEEKIQVIYNAVDMNETYNNILKEEINIDKNSYVVGFVGRFSKQKAPDIFIESARLIKELIPEAFFIMLGKGEELELVREKICNYGLINCFKIIEWVSNPKSYMSIIDIGVLPSRWEGFGLVITEFMSLRKVVVASDVDAIPEIITNYWNGFLVKEGDYNSIANEIYKIYKDKKLYKKIGNNGYLTVSEKFNIRQFIQKHEQLFQEVKEKVNEN